MVELYFLRFVRKAIEVVVWRVLSTIFQMCKYDIASVPSDHTGAPEV